MPPHLEALELRDFNARHLSPAPEQATFLHGALSDAELDALFVAEMERRDRLAACRTGYRDAACEACDTALYVPVGQGGDVLCPQCQPQGEALAAEEDDDHPRPPAGGATRPDYPHFAALAGRLLDDQLCDAIGTADAAPAEFHLHHGGQREAFLAAMSAEVVRRRDGRQAA